MVPDFICHADVGKIDFPSAFKMCLWVKWGFCAVLAMNCFVLFIYCPFSHLATALQGRPDFRSEGEERETPGCSDCIAKKHVCIRKLPAV